MTETVKNFIERVTRLEARYAKDKHATTLTMPRELMIALRDELKAHQEIEAALRHLIDMARTSGGVACRDELLCAALDRAELSLASQGGER